MEIPPASKVKPFPTRTVGCPLGAFACLCSIMMKRGSSELPAFTPSRQPIFSFSIFFLSQTVTLRPEAFKEAALSARIVGVIMFPGRSPSRLVK